MNLLDFNLTLANYKSDSVVTRSGLPVKIICTDNEGPYPIVALVKLEGESCPTPHQYTKEGKFNLNGKESELDLFILGEDRSDLFSDIEDCLTNAFQNIQEFYKEEKDELTVRAKAWANKILGTALPEGTIIVKPEALQEFERELITMCHHMYEATPTKHFIYNMASEEAKEIVEKLKKIVKGRTKTDAGWPR